MSRYTPEQHEQHAHSVWRDGITILREHFSPELIQRWAEAFAPMLEEAIGGAPNRGAHRHYVTLPLAAPFADPGVLADEDILAIVDRLMGPDPVLCQLATDTPVLGSDYQALHRDTPPLFPETALETPAFQLAVNFPLCDVTLENGPFETSRGTHMMARQLALASIERGEIKLEPVSMRRGDVMIRDVRAIHRGTPNRTAQPRPMVVLGYSRRWLWRPEVHIEVPRAVLDSMPQRLQALLRFNPVLDAGERPDGERYQNFMY